MANTKKATGALQGGTIGAQVGTAIMPGIGTAIGAGVGALGGALLTSGKPTEYEEFIGESLEDLKRRQELNQLGLTKQEIDALMRLQVDPVKRAQKDARDAFLEQAAGADLGAASFQRGLQGEQQRTAEALDAPLARIALTDEQRKREEEQQIFDLMAIQADIDMQQKEQLMSGVQGAAQALAIGSIAAGDLTADLEALDSASGAIDTSLDDAKELGGFWQFFSPKPK